MNRIAGKSISGMSVLKFIVLLSVAVCITPPPSAAATQMTVIGTVSSDYQIVTDTGDIYEVNEGEAAEKVLQLVGKRVEVIGLVEEQGGNKTITIESFRELDL